MNLIQISVLELHNDLILPIPQGGFFGARNVDGKLCIGYTFMRKYMPIYIKPMRNIDHIKQGRKTCLSVMLLQPDFNKCRLSKLDKLDKLYINSASTRLLQRSKIYFVE